MLLTLRQKQVRKHRSYQQNNECVFSTRREPPQEQVMLSQVCDGDCCTSLSCCSKDPISQTCGGTMYTIDFWKTVSVAISSRWQWQASSHPIDMAALVYAIQSWEKTSVDTKGRRGERDYLRLRKSVVIMGSNKCRILAIILPNLSFMRRFILNFVRHVT